MIQMSKKLQDLFNRQVVRENASDIIYRQMASVMRDMGYEGFHHWFMKQAEEEHSHALKFADYMEEHCCVVKYDTIEALPLKGDKDKNLTLASMVEQTVEHEVFIRDSIAEIMDVARAEKDYGTEHFLLGMLREQIEEIDSVDTMKRRVLLCDCPEAFLILDQQLSTR